MVKNSKLKVLIILIISIAVVYLSAGIILSAKTYAVYKRSEIPQAYTEDSFVSASNYIRLSPYESSVFDENGHINSDYSCLQCDTDHFLLFPFLMYKDGRLALRGSYSYSYTLKQGDDERNSSATGEIFVCYDVSIGNVRIDEICYAL